MKTILLFFCSCVYLAQSQVPPGAVGYWPFDNHAQDMSGNGNHGFANAVTPARDRFNQPGKAYKFNGNSSHVVVPHNAAIDIANGVSFTFAYWQKAYAGNKNAVVITKHTLGVWDGYNFIANNQSNSGYCTGADHMYWYVASGAQEDACSNGPVLADSAWHFMVGTYDAALNESKLYIDNVLQADIGKRSGTVSTPANLSFGYDDDIKNLYFHGVLDGARLYKRVLTPSELTGLFHEGGTVTGMGRGEDIFTTVTVKPNPSEGWFAIEAGAEAIGGDFKVLDEVGRLVLSGTLTAERSEFNCALAAGLYYVIVESRNAISLPQKMVICR